MGLFSSQIDTKTMVPVCRQLATAYGAGLPLIQSLEQVGAQARNAAVRRVFRQMSEDLRKGATLAEAAAAQKGRLSPFFIQLLASGERGGRLDVMLRDLAQYFEDRLAMQREMMGLMIIPVMQLLAAWVFGTFALGLIPHIRSGMSSGQSFDIMEYFGEYGRFQAKAGAALLAALVAAIVLSRAGLLQWLTGWVSTHVWPVSRITRKFGLARFFRSFALLLGSGLPITRCIEGAAAVTANPYIERDLLKAVRPVKEGATLVEAFSRARFLTPLSREMLLVGEQSGRLEQQMIKISEYHFEEARHAASAATKVLYFLIVLIVALIVGSVVIGFYSSLYGGILDELGV